MPWLSKKRRVPPTQPVKSRPAANPLFTPDQNWSAFRHRVLLATVGALAAAGLGLAAYGPWFRLTTVSVRGTRMVDAASVRQVTEHFLDGQRWLVLPRRTAWLLPAGQLERFLVKEIGRRLSVERVVVDRAGRHGLIVVVTERTPIFRWTDGNQEGAIDRHGVLIGLSQGPADAALPLIVDVSAEPLAVDKAVVSEELTRALSQLASLLTGAQLPVAAYKIPAPQCPLDVATTTNMNANANTNTDEPPKNNNVNEVPKTVPGFTNTSTEPPACDLQALKRASPEIHVQLDKGPLLMFDRHQNLSRAVDIVRRLMADSKNAKAAVIDVRFEERVYVR